MRYTIRHGPVTAYENHCVHTEDVRAFRFRNGKLQTNLIGVVQFRASFPSFKPESCATSLKLHITIANFCTRSQSTDDRADIWVGELTGKFHDSDVVCVGFWPSMSVVRDLEHNPLLTQCGDGHEITVMSSSSTIDRYLLITDFWLLATGSNQ